MGKSDYELSWGENEVCHFIKDDKEVLNCRGSKLNIQESARTPNGRQLILLTSKFLTCFSNKTKIGIVGITSDITEQKILEKNFMQYEGGIGDTSFYDNSVCKQLDEYINKLKIILDFIKKPTTLRRNISLDTKIEK